MSKFGFGTYALMVTVVFWGVLLGGVVYSHIVFFPVFLSHLPESSAVVNGPYGLVESRFWLTVHPALLLSLIISIAVNWRIPTRRNRVATTFAVYVLVLIASSLYFIPELIQFAASSTSNIPASEWLARGNRWQYLSWVRGTTLFIFSFPLLAALAEPLRDNEDR